MRCPFALDRENQITTKPPERWRPAYSRVGHVKKANPVPEQLCLHMLRLALSLDTGADAARQGLLVLQQPLHPLLTSNAEVDSIFRPIALVHPRLIQNRRPVNPEGRPFWTRGVCSGSYLFSFVGEEESHVFALFLGGDKKVGRSRRNCRTPILLWLDENPEQVGVSGARRRPAPRSFAASTILLVPGYMDP